MSETDRAKWDDRYRRQDRLLVEPAVFLEVLDAQLPRSGRAIDVAGGAGRNAVWLARRGLEVTVADISPVGLAMATAKAEAADVRIETLEIDFEHEAFPAGPWDLIVGFCYLERSLFEAFAGALSPGGLLVYSHPTRRNLERHDRPPAEFLLEEGELRRLVTGLEIVRYEEDWLEEGRHEARVVARRCS